MDLCGFLKVIVLIQIICLSVEQGGIGPDYDTVPEKCQASEPELLRRYCCIFPPFFTRKIGKECGAYFGRQFYNKETNVSGLLRHIPDDCDHWKCVLQKYRLISSDGNLDEDKYYQHLDKWVDLNPPFATILLNAKIHCKQYFRTMMPLDPCDYFEFQKCIRQYIKVSCPTPLPTPECREQKAFYDECKEYYV